MRAPKKAFPSGADSPYQGEMSRSDRGDRERWHGEAVTDEGAMTERFRFLQGGFRRLRAASDFARGGKVTKTPPGDAADGHFVPIGPPPYPLCRFTTSPPDRGSRPPAPHLRGLPLGVGKTFPARKIRSA